MTNYREDSMSEQEYHNDQQERINQRFTFTCRHCGADLALLGIEQRFVDQTLSRFCADGIDHHPNPSFA